jgi:adenosylhomocysteine nucleosidase
MPVDQLYYLKSKYDSPLNIIVLISADKEWHAIKDIFIEAHLCNSPFGEYFCASIDLNQYNKSRLELPPIPEKDDNLSHPDSVDILFFQGGWGKISASASTQYVIDRWNPELIINLGTCGGIKGEVDRGTIILANETIVYDIIELMGDLGDHIDHYSTQLDLTWLKDDYPHPVLKTRLVSGDRDLLIEEISRIKEEFNAVAGDWESGAIAYIASLNNTRLLILRGVTDLVNENGGEAYGDIRFYESEAASILNRLVKALPGWLLISNIQ